MNEKFYELPAAKQQRIINAGLEVFGAHDYPLRRMTSQPKLESPRGYFSIILKTKKSSICSCLTTVVNSFIHG